ncbi:VOC family protein [Dermatophilaceae bacterium Soc4.6]
MPLVTSTAYAHVRLNVTDIERSKAFYDDLFGWPVAIDAREHSGEDGVEGDPQRFYGGVVYQMPGGTLFGLRPVGRDRFDADRTGLDHVSFTVESRRVLVAAAEALDEAGIEHGEVIDLGGSGTSILSIQDPDGINLELTAVIA